MSDNITSIFTGAGFTEQDYCFPADLLDKGVRDMFGFEKPLPPESRNGNKWTKHSGVYAWIDDTTNTIMYIGTASRLWLRLTQHWCRESNFLYDWISDVDDGIVDYGFMPVVAVWVTDDRHELEIDMIEKLQPVYNKYLK